MNVSASVSRFAIWKDLESRKDTWTSVGALAIGVAATTVMLLF